MLVYTTNLLALPLILIIWVIDFYVVVSGMRLIASHIDADWARRGCARLAVFTDPVHRTACKLLAPGRARPLPRWLTWLLLLSTAVLVRQVLIWIILR
ncbi:hypothetical protein ACFL09_00125 [Planctomycetota bacterium]